MHFGFKYSIRLRKTVCRIFQVFQKILCKLYLSQSLVVFLPNHHGFPSSCKKFGRINIIFPSRMRKMNFTQHTTKSNRLVGAAVLVGASGWKFELCQKNEVTKRVYTVFRLQKCAGMLHNKIYP